VLVVPPLAMMTVLGERLWTSNLILGLCALAARALLHARADDTLAGSLHRSFLNSTTTTTTTTSSSSGSPARARHPTLPAPTLRRRFTESSANPLHHHVPLNLPESPTSHLPLLPHQPFLTVYRAQLVLLTALSILAVDFTVFPRKFAKTESWGISLMDAGVGSFVFSQAIIDARPILTRRPQTQGTAVWKDVWRSTRKTMPLLVLGLVRILFVKGVDYPEHVTEYGVHWNFFFTLSILPMTGVMARRLYEVWGVNLALMGVLLAVVHQAVLSLGGVEEYVMSSAGRTTLVSANREGLASLPGYATIYVLGLSAGTYILPPSPDFLARRASGRRLPDKRQPGKALVVYCSWAILWWTGFLLARTLLAAPSRRLANPTYCFWIAATNLSVITGHSLVREVLLSGGPRVPELLEAINRNGLAVFLAANLLTGFINLSVHSIFLPARPALALLLAYALAILAFAWSLRNVKLSL